VQAGKNAWYFDRPRGKSMLEQAIKNAAEELPSSVLNEYIGDQARADGTFAISNYSARVTSITNMFGKGFTPEQVCQVCFFMTHVFCMNTFVLGVSLMFVPTAPLPHLSCVLPTSSSPHLSPAAHRRKEVFPS
jgi:hypothetical protein